MTLKKPTLSGIVITLNEEKRIRSCLEALKFCDEVLVIDSGSKDDTVAIAKSYSVKTEFQKESDFSSIRNRAIVSTGGEWLLYVDADEVVTSKLASEILQTVSDWKIGEPVAYTLNRKNFYLGQVWPTHEQMLRLFRRDSLVRWEGRLHESAIVKGEIGHLQSQLIHTTHRNLEEMVDKTNIWSDTEAKLRLGVQHPPVSWWRLLRVMWTGFSNSYFRERGWRAGTVGLIESMYQGFSVFITYAKLWELQQKSK